MTGKSLLSVLVAASAVFVSAGEPGGAEKKAASVITSVTLHPAAARVTRTAEISFDKGGTSFVISGLPDVEAEYVSAESSSPDAVLTDFSIEKKISDIPVPDEKLRKAERRCAALMEKCELLEKQLKQTENRILSFYNLKPAVQSNTDRKNGGKPDFDKKAWENFIIYSWQTQLEEKTVRRDLLFDRLPAARLELAAARRELERLSAGVRKSEIYARAVIKAEKPGKTKIAVTYNIRNAGWHPVYELRVDEKKNTAVLNSFAYMRQSTGEDWNGVPLYFSNLDPFVSFSIPSFTKKLIAEEFNDSPLDRKTFGGSDAPIPPPPSETFRMKKAYAAINVRADSARREEAYFIPWHIANKYALSFGAEPARYTITLDDGNVSTFFGVLSQESGKLKGTAGGRTVFSVPVDGIKNIIAERVEPRGENYEKPDSVSSIGEGDYLFRAMSDTVNIPSEMKCRKIPYASRVFTPEFFYETAPAFSAAAYLNCRLSKDLPRLEGPVDVFLGSRLITRSEIGGDDEFTADLGSDPRVKVEYSTQKTSETVGVFSKSRRTVFSSDISAVNNTPSPVKLIIREIVPVSRTEKVKISSLSLSPALATEKDETILADGVAVFEKTIDPGRKISQKVSYAVEYPEDFVIRYTTDFGNSGTGFGNIIDNPANRK